MAENIALLMFAFLGAVNAAAAFKGGGWVSRTFHGAAAGMSALMVFGLLAG